MRKPSVLVIFLTVFIDLIGFGIVLPLLPLYNRDLGAAGWLIGVIQASFSVMQFLFAPGWGRLSDRIGRRPVMVLGLLLQTAGYAWVTARGSLATSWVELDLAALQLETGRPFQVHELMSGARYTWHGARNYVQLNPHIVPAHIFRIRRKVRTERDFEYFL